MFLKTNIGTPVRYVTYRYQMVGSTELELEPDLLIFLGPSSTQKERLREAPH